MVSLGLAWISPTTVEIAVQLAQTDLTRKAFLPRTETELIRFKVLGKDIVVWC